ncbi:MAG: hypothetical protein K2M97_07190, partial [Muribaculaceae bacterium]|nr:hypothetical protein [Muribaculaceae bacterium]
MIRRFRLLTLLISSILGFAASAQMLEPIKWTHEFTVNGDEAILKLSATIEPGWHLYATELDME